MLINHVHTLGAFEGRLVHIGELPRHGDITIKNPEKCGEILQYLRDQAEAKGMTTGFSAYQSIPQGTSQPIWILPCLCLMLVSGLSG